MNTPGKRYISCSVSVSVINHPCIWHWLRLPGRGWCRVTRTTSEKPKSKYLLNQTADVPNFSLTCPKFIVEYLMFSEIFWWSCSWPSCASIWGWLWMVKTIWSNDQVRPGPEHGDNQHHPQKQQIQQCTQHCSHVQSHYQFTLSQNITTSCCCSTTSLDRTLPTYCLAEWRPRPPSMEPCEGVDGIVGPSYGPSLRGRQDSNFLGTRVPILLWVSVVGIYTVIGVRC